MVRVVSSQITCHISKLDCEEVKCQCIWKHRTSLWRVNIQQRKGCKIAHSTASGNESMAPHG